jgi:hypothetical protein
MSIELETKEETNVALRQRAFLEAFAQCGSVVKASQGVCHRASHYRWMEESPSYRREFAVARRLFGDLLTQEATYRALVGTDEPVFHKGQPMKDQDGNAVTRKKTDRYLLKHLMALHNGAADSQENATKRDTLTPKKSKTIKSGS